MQNSNPKTIKRREWLREQEASSTDQEFYLFIFLRVGVTLPHNSHNVGIPRNIILSGTNCPWLIRTLSNHPTCHRWRLVRAAHLHHVQSSTIETIFILVIFITRSRPKSTVEIWEVEYFVVRPALELSRYTSLGWFCFRESKNSIELLPFWFVPKTYFVTPRR